VNTLATPDTHAAPTLTALNGIRFFAVFLIFLHHVWGIRFESPRGEGPWANAYSTLDRFPEWFINLLSHGYVATSFFFLLSGFILSYLYWTPGGELSTTRERFWWQRLTRIYPAHLIAFGITLLLGILRFLFDPNAPSAGLAVASAVTTATLTQSWFAPLVPIWSWPTWALSAIVFLYLIMPWLMGTLAKLSRATQIALLAASPLISLLPTLIFLHYFPDGAKGQQNWQIFIAATPLFWVAQFVAGMLMSRIFGISRFEQAWRMKSKPWVSFGDLALAVVIAIAVLAPQDEVWRLIMRHGALMPLYMLAIHDLALGRGLAARVFALPGMDFLGQLSFSIFIWQNLFMMFGFMIIMAAPDVPDASFLFAVFGLLGMSMISTFFIEKPLARRLRKRYPAVRESAGVPAADGREAS